MATKPRGKTVEVEIWTDRYRIKGQVFIPLGDLGAYKDGCRTTSTTPKERLFP
jgi:hypothetical protein